MTTLDLHHLVENTVTDRFWGRLAVERAAALLPYSQGTPAQRLMWLLKYDNRPEVGVKLGGWLGQLIKNSFVFGEVDYVVPVPLHEAKLRTRGYNQAERVAAGIAEVINAECLPFAVKRKQFTETQTRKSQFERMENVESVFELSQRPQQQNANDSTLHLLSGKHVLLVDDVMTTGATLEALGRAVLPAKPASFKVAVLALARF
jgi:predicted amidophosphoribosyltransferase